MSGYANRGLHRCRQVAPVLSRRAEWKRENYVVARNLVGKQGKTSGKRGKSSAKRRELVPGAAGHGGDPEGAAVEVPWELKGRSRRPWPAIFFLHNLLLCGGGQYGCGRCV